MRTVPEQLRILIALLGQSRYGTTAAPLLKLGGGSIGVNQNQRKIEIGLRFDLTALLESSEAYG